MENLKIEYLKLKDMEQYKNLIDQCFGNSNEVEYYKTQYKKKNENLGIIVAKQNNKIIGSITYYQINLFTFSFQPALELFNVAVLEEYRGNRVAELLLDFVIDFAKENKYKSIYLTCLDTAYSAHRFYEKVGFEKKGSLKYSLDIET